MLTKTGVNNLLQRIWDSSGLSEEMEGDINKLRSELDEREGILKKYGNWYDGEDKEEFDYTERERQTTDSEWKRKYDDMRKRYVSRFFNSGSDSSSDINDDVNDTSNTTQPITIAELLRRA